MGEVYRAHDPRLRRDVAIKVIAAPFSTDPNLLKRFSQEALASAALNHPNIVAVFDFGTHEGCRISSPNCSKANRCAHGSPGGHSRVPS
jgi:serine/threonine protein kinase